ncbi:family 78 glycoside hydrolase catalytic domain [Paenibacillus mendelii]|uniref:alpha-L-rhamnosidase n=1 Tax=Paenibacillus mendelii TaxID=206163 RepID=A0ABV6JCH6_9BACL|nr:family 78 glycoside hydrolase catalytic domain [Paenibacillus mendelii]MCQ6561602.1 glycoside hydrolase family 78 protein [Paenibacillus mendelii]
MDKTWTGLWITDERFTNMPKLELFHKELEIRQTHSHEESMKNVHMLIHKTFELNRVGKEAWLDITADDYYKLYINGQLVGQGPAQSSNDHYYYNRYNVTPYLKQGNNVIAVHLYYQGLICRAYNSGDYRQGMIAELEMDGRLIVYSDQTWLYRIAEEYSSGGIIGYNTQFLEAIDSRKKRADWREPSPTGWKPCHTLNSHDYKLLLQPTPPVSVYTIKPQQIVPLPEGGFWIDFGHELTGQLQLKACGQAGDVVEIRCGEELLELQGGVRDGREGEPQRVRFNMRCNCDYRELWTLSGAVDEPDFYDYKAFRYAEIISPVSVSIDLDSIHAIARHYPLDGQASHFHSSNAMLNQIWSICSNGVKWGSQENYVDCPSREKGQYLGDNTIITHAHTYISGDLRLFRKSLLDFQLYSQKVCAGFTAVAPGHHMQEIADFSLQWPMQLLQYYRQSGDAGFLRDMLPAAEGILQHFRQFERDDGLLERVTDKWNLVDWPEGMRDGYDFPLTLPVGDGCHNVLNAFYYGSWSDVLQIREILALDDDLRDRRQQAKRREAFRVQFYDQDNQWFVDAAGSSHHSLHANALPLLFGLVDEGKEEESIVRLIRRKRLGCGVYMAYFVLQALAKAGEYDLLYELIVSDDANSWSTMVKEGATTCFEAWSKEAKWNTSLCHPWGSAPIPLLIEHIAGIQPAEPGWTEVSFNPKIPASLTELRLSFRTVAGEFVLEHGKGQTQLKVPDGVLVRGCQNGW